MNQDQIDILIRDENDPKTRTVLVVVQSLVITLNSVADLIKEIESKFDTHKLDYETTSRRTEEVLIRGQVLYRVVLGVLVIAQSAVIGVGSYAYNSITSTRDLTLKHEYVISELQGEVQDNAVGLNTAMQEVKRLTTKP
jgi:hypothetical protein